MVGIVFPARHHRAHASPTQVRTFSSLMYSSPPPNDFSSGQETDDPFSVLEIRSTATLIHSPPPHLLVTDAPIESRTCFPGPSPTSTVPDPVPIPAPFSHSRTFSVPPSGKVPLPEGSFCVDENELQTGVGHRFFAYSSFAFPFF